MKNTLYLGLDFLTGMVISIMVVANTLLGQATTMGVSLIINHSIGLTILLLILFFGRANPTIRGPKRYGPWYLYFNGIIGIAILNLNYVTILEIGASLAMACTVFGQSLSSLIFDLTGFMGMQKRTLSKVKILCLTVSGAGILVMATSSGGSFAFLFVLLSVLAGVLTMTQMIFNSSLATFIGPIKASLQNFLGGLGGGLLFYGLFQHSQTIVGFQKVGSVVLPLVGAGGLLAVFVVVSTSFVIVKVPAIYSALLLSSAQILMSLAIDALFFDTFSLSLFLGAVLMLVGMFGNLVVDRYSATRS